MPSCRFEVQEEQTPEPSVQPGAGFDRASDDLENMCPRLPISGVTFERLPEVSLSYIVLPQTQTRTSELEKP